MKYFVELDHECDDFTVGLLYEPFFQYGKWDPWIRVENGKQYPLGGIEDETGYVVEL